MNAIDAHGTRHRRCDDHGKLRIVSLVPSLTELLCAVGLGGQVVGRTRACARPADEVERIAKVGGVADIDLERIRELAPTHVVADIGENGPAMIASLEAFVPHVVVVHPRSPRDNVELYRLFGHVFACEQMTDRLCARFEAAWETLMDARRASSTGRRVLVLTGMDPWTTIACDTYLAAMLAVIGWQQIAIDVDARDDTMPSSSRRPAIVLDRAVRGAELVLLASGPDCFTDSHVAMLEARGLTVRMVDGELLSWPGSRAIAGLEYLAMLATL